MHIFAKRIYFISLLRRWYIGVIRNYSCWVQVFIFRCWLQIH